ncbi:hypothetical protein QU42_21450 [Bradyrhizobium sp. UASWS1016]|nr:hypothetical protein QU41_35640 [Bradyrhizobium elkanii]OCX28630.1 hypothetical protein QU42_21450 [Bradyrhizobium sp. UASWS1016]
MPTSGKMFVPMLAPYGARRAQAMPGIANPSVFITAMPAESDWRLAPEPVDLAAQRSLVGARR